MPDADAPIICTVGGRAFNPLDPDPSALDIEDMAHALSYTARFGGHCLNFYSVAQHSLVVADLLAEDGHDSELRLAALLHDASEAYLVDLPTPIKRHVADYRAIEDRLQAVIERHFGVADVADANRDRIKRADRLALQWEQRDLMPRVSWVPIPPMERPTLTALPPDTARRRWRGEILMALRMRQGGIPAPEPQQLD